MEESVIAFLERHRRGRPQTFAEIVAGVDKSAVACSRELARCVLFGEIRVIRLRFNGRECPFYTVRRDVLIEVVRS